MACDLSDLNITKSYQSILNEDADWLVLGYKGTRDQIFLYESGKGGLDDLCAQIHEQIHFCLLRLNQKELIYIVYVESDISGVKRARSVVHGRSVGNLFEKQTMQITVSNKKELDEKLNKLPSALTSPKTSEVLSELPDSINETANTDRESISAEPINEPETPVEMNAEPGQSVPNSTIEQDSVHSIPNPTQDEPQQRDYENHESFKPSISIDTGDRRQSRFIPNNPSLRTEEDYRNYNLEIKSRLQEAIQIQERTKQRYSKEANSPTQLSGYISVQGGGCYFWKRRWFVLKPTTLYFFRDTQESVPLSFVDLKASKYNIQEAWNECLIPNSFKIDFDKSGSYYFFSDDNRQKDLAIAALNQSAA